ncbi:hypothetical protein KCP74_15020 [Salmonella enterica subsp. enterica]|nr:hypothetical protein KCP74_15020 [Salmonella enterica subsp. enterica]
MGFMQAGGAIIFALRSPGSSVRHQLHNDQYGAPTAELLIDCTRPRRQRKSVVVSYHLPPEPQPGMTYAAFNL